MSDINKTLKEVNDSRKFATDYINSIFDYVILLECKMEKLKAENEKMRAALEAIAEDGQPPFYSDNMAELARAALAEIEGRK